MEFPFYYIFPPPCSEWFPLKFLLFTWMVSLTLLSLLYYLQVAGWCECMWKNEEAVGWCECKRMNKWLVGMVGVLLKKFVEEENDEKKYTYILEEVPTRWVIYFSFGSLFIFFFFDKVVLLLWKLIACLSLVKHMH